MTIAVRPLLPNWGMAQLYGKIRYNRSAISTHKGATNDRQTDRDDSIS